MAMSAGTAYVQIKPDLGSFSKDLSKGISGAGAGIASFGGALTKSITLPLVGIATVAGGVGIATAAAMEQSGIAFKTFYGSVEASEAVMKDLADFAASTPFDLPGITDASKKLASVGVAADDLIPIMTGVGDAVAGVGGGSQQIDQVAFAMQQVIGQGRAMTQDINQIASTGIPIWGELAAQMGVSETEIRDLASQGKITDDVLQAAFTNPVGPLTTFSGLMEEQSGTLAGQWSTLKDTINIALADSLTAALPAIKDGLSQLTEAIGPALQAAGPAFSAIVEAMVPLIGVVADVLTWFSELSPEMQRLAVYTLVGAAAMGPIVGMFGRLLQVVAPVVKVAGGLGKFVGTILKMSRAFGVLKTFVILFNILKLTIVTGLRTIGLAFLTNPIGLLITAIVLVVAGVVYLIVRYWDQIKAAFTAALSWIGSVLSSLWSAIKTAFAAIVGVFQTVWTAIQTAFAAVAGVFTAVWNVIWGFVQGLIAVVAPIFTTFFAIITLPFRIWWTVVSAIFQLAWALIQYIFNAIVDFVVPIWQSVWDAVSSALSKAWDFISGVLKTVWDFIVGVFNAIKSTVVSVWNALWGAVKSAWNAAYGFIKGGIQAARDFVVNAFNSMKDKVSSIWDAIRGIVQRAVDAVKGIAEGIWGGLKGVINTGIGLLNSAIRGFNKIIGAVNKVPGVSVPTIPEIPKLAAGGIVQRPTLAVVGEAGPEAVVPLSRMSRYFEMAGGKDKPIYLEVKIGEQSITDMIERTRRRDDLALAGSLSRGRRL